MKNINDYAQDFATVWAAMDRTDKQIEETNKQLAETQKIVAETSRKVDETTENIKTYLADLKEARKDIGGISRSNGMHAESYFFESLKRSKQFGGITYDYVEDDYKTSKKMPNGKKIVGQYDIVMHNGDSVAIIEVKHKVKEEDVIDLVERKVDMFKLLFPEYANDKIYLGVAGFSYDKNAEQEAIDRGIGILKLVGENVEIEDKHLRIY